MWSHTRSQGPRSADLLRVRLQQRDPDEAKDLHRRAAEWHHDNGDLDRAIHHAWAAGDGARTVQLIEANADALLLRREGATLERWLERLPAGLVDTRRLTLARARIAIYGGRLQTADELLDLADQLGSDPRHPPEDTPESERGPLDTLGPTTVLLRAYSAHMRGDADAAIDLANAAVEVDGTTTTGLLARWHLAAGPWLRGDTTEAEPALAANVADWRRAGHPDRAALSANRLGRIQRARGDLDAAMDTYQQILEQAADRREPDAPTTGIAHIGIAEVAYERNALDTARVHARLGISKCRDFIYTQPLATGWSILARIHHAEGDRPATKAAMATALQLAPGGDVVDLLNPVPAQMAQLSIAVGDMEAAERWSRTRSLPPDAGAAHRFEPAHVAMARLDLARREPSAALERLDPLRTLAAAQRRHGSLLEIDALRALALKATADDAAAIDALSHSIDLAAPSRYVRVFIDEGEPMLALLELLAESAADLDDIDRANVERLIEAGRAGAGRGARSPNDRLVVPLTERELEVLAQLVDGKPNKDICAELFISLNTVKKHITHIFDKLGVTNRTAAVSRARELGILNEPAADPRTVGYHPG